MSNKIFFLLFLFQYNFIFSQELNLHEGVKQEKIITERELQEAKSKISKVILESQLFPYKFKNLVDYYQKLVKAKRETKSRTKGLYALFTDNDVTQLGNTNYTIEYFERRGLNLEQNFRDFKLKFLENSNGFRFVEIAWLIHFYRAIGAKKNKKFIDFLTSMGMSLKKDDIIGLFNHLNFKFTLCDLKYLADNREHRNCILDQYVSLDKLHLLNLLLVVQISKTDLLKFKRIDFMALEFAFGQKKLTKLNINKSE